MTITIPVNGYFTTFGKGRIIKKMSDETRGTFIQFDGIVCVFYKYPNYRRAYIVVNAHASASAALNISVKLPNITQRVIIIHKLRGRQIDVLKKVCYYLEEWCGGAVYQYSILLWQRLAYLIDTFYKYSASLFNSYLLQLVENYHKEASCYERCKPRIIEAPAR